MNLVSLVLQVVGIVGVFIAIGQLLEIRKKRQVDMYLELFNRYVAKESQESRAVLTIIEKALGFDPKEFSPEDWRPGDPVKDISPFVNDYISKFKAYEREALGVKQGDEARTREEHDRKARFRLRFVNHAGVLLTKRLVDKDLLFELLGPGLAIDYPTLQVIADAYRKDHGVQVYRKFEFLVDRYERWAGKRLPPLGSRSSRGRAGQGFLSQISVSPFR